MADAGRHIAPRLDSWHQLPKTIRPIRSLRRLTSSGSVALRKRSARLKNSCCLRFSASSGIVAFCPACIINGTCTIDGTRAGTQVPEGVDAMSKKHMGSSIDDFLKEEGVFEEAQARAVKEVVAWQLVQAMKEKKISKTAWLYCSR